MGNIKIEAWAACENEIRQLYFPQGTLYDSQRIDAYSQSAHEVELVKQVCYAMLGRHSLGESAH